MPAETATPTALKLSFDLFEELKAAASSWDLDFRQLGPSSRPYQLEQVSTPDTIYNRSAFFSRFHQLGGSPAGFRTFTLLARGSREFRWCGELITGDTLLIMPESGDFESMSPPGLDTFHLSLSTALLAKLAREHFECDLSDLLGTGRQLCRHAGDNLLQLRRVLHQLSAELPAGLGRGASTLTPGRERYLAYLLLSILRRGLEAPRGARSRRMRALTTALEVLQSSEGRISVPELVAAADTSRRTLENAFQDILAVSPATYIKAHRLQRLRDDLLLARPGADMVGRLALRHGFKHGGQLAADYLALYGELPAATLRR